MRKDKDFIKLTLAVYSQGVITIDEAVAHIVCRYKQSCMFNYHNFSLGFYLGLFIGTILFKYILK